MSFLPAADTDLLTQIAAQFGTPTYTYHAGAIVRQVQELRNRFKELPFRLLYAMKANANPAVIGLMRDLEVGIDAVSPGEALLAVRMGIPPEHVLFSANNMSDAEMHDAHAKGLLINIGELSRLDRYGRAYPGASVCLRINPNIGAGHHEHVITAGEHSKFGIPVTELDNVRELLQAHDLHLVGLHQHIGSGILDSEIIWKAMQVLLKEALAFPELQFINFGGGFGIAYRPNEASLDLKRLADLLVDPLRSFKRMHPSPDLAFWFEPGRFLVAECGVLLTQVNTIKHANGRVFAGTDSGMGHLVRPAIYGAYHPIYNITNPEGAKRPYDVVGNICESADMFARDRLIAEIREGDVLAIGKAGAYGMAMASIYNMRPMPAEVFIPLEGPPLLTRRRLTPMELTEQQLSLIPLPALDA